MWWRSKMVGGNMEKISAVYQVINTITGDRYVGSSKDVERRWAYHKCPSVWEHLNRPLYKDMQKYGIDKFKFQILAPGRSKGMGTEWDKEVVGKVDPQKRVLCVFGFLSRSIDSFFKSHSSFQSRIEACIIYWCSVHLFHP